MGYKPRCPRVVEVLDKRTADKAERLPPQIRRLLASQLFSSMKNTLLHLCWLLAALPTLGGSTALAQKLDAGPDRVSTDLAVAMPRLGTVKPRSTAEIGASNWLIGCETLDRDFADYDQYKTYIAPLGIKRLRMQAGWNKTEKVKGKYDWKWLDNIINDAHKRGLQPWLQLSYGNQNYPGGGGANLGAGMPTSPEALAAWDRWVEALVKRYKGKVTDWEIWNEPNFADNLDNTPERTAALHVRTIDIVKRVQPEARISGLALGHMDLPYAEAFFKALADQDRLKLLDNITYHDYTYNPDSHYPKVLALRASLHKYAPGMRLRQGENGAPSGGGYGRGALAEHDWTELTQAKWDTRRMLGDLGHDVETSIFGIIEMAYTNGPINRMNYKGIIKSDSSKKALGPKMAYYAIQNVTSIFDNSLQRIEQLEGKHNAAIVPTNPDAVVYTKGTDRNLAVYGYRHVTTKKQLYTIWANDHVPAESNKTRNLTFTFANADIDQPVYVDIVSGRVYEIPATQWKKVGNIYTFTDIPVYDAPILIADKSLIKIQPLSTARAANPTP
ncbi:GH39 family glycosyl hydrolase [Hymenobacter arizonensis]|uniref:GH39 family glycosyl hydrolase n=1 Tax=Hymenobacter arizonensis TaxID=1227077 RepID=UPI003F70629B